MEINPINRTPRCIYYMISLSLSLRSLPSAAGPWPCVIALRLQNPGIFANGSKVLGAQSFITFYLTCLVLAHSRQHKKVEVQHSTLWLFERLKGFLFESRLGGTREVHFGHACFQACFSNHFWVWIQMSGIGKPIFGKTGIAKKHFRIIWDC